MTIEIHQPELEALIHRRMDSGRFETIEEMLKDALTSCSYEDPSPYADERSGLALVEAMQACPYPEIEIEPSRIHMPASDPVTL